MNTTAVATVEPIRLREAAVFYLAALAGIALLTALSLGPIWTPLWILPLAYVVAGCTLNRLVLRRLVEFHPLYDTVPVVAKTKLSYALLWPIAYAYLLAMLLIDRIL